MKKRYLVYDTLYREVVAEFASWDEAWEKQYELNQDDLARMHFGYGFNLNPSARYEIVDADDLEET